MTVLFSDDFNRADGGLGSNYTSLGVPGQVLSNAYAGSGTPTLDYVNAVTPPADCYIEVTVPVLTADGQAIILRLDTTVFTWYEVSWNTTTSQIARFDSGIPVSLQTTALPTAGDTRRLQVIGNVISVYDNGAQVGTTTDGTYTAAGRGALYSNNTVGRLDNLVIGDTNLTLSLAGQSAAFSSGSVSAAHASPLTGASGSFSAGSLIPNRSIALAGSLVSGATGSMSPDHSTGITGSPGTFSAGAITTNTGVLLTGQTGSFAAGTLTVSIAVPLTGQPGTFAAGTITYSAGGDISIALTGQSATFTAGTLTPSTSIPLAGQAGAFSAGTLSPAFSVTISGATGTFSSGTLTCSQAIALQGAIAYFSTGIITPSGGTPVGGGEGHTQGFIVNVGTLMVRQ